MFIQSLFLSLGLITILSGCSPSIKFRLTRVEYGTSYPEGAANPDYKAPRSTKVSYVNIGLATSLASEDLSLRDATLQEMLAFVHEWPEGVHDHSKICAAGSRQSITGWDGASPMMILENGRIKWDMGADPCSWYVVVKK